MTADLIHIATITQPHGLKGQFKLHSLLDSNRSFSHFSNFFDVQGNPLPLKLVSTKGKQPIGMLDGIDDRNDVEPIRQTKIYAKAEDLPETSEGEYYSYELVGLNVQNTDGETIGQVLEHHNFGAGDILEIKLANGKTELLPFIDEVFPQLDMDARVIILTKPEYI